MRTIIEIVGDPDDPDPQVRILSGYVRQPETHRPLRLSEILAILDGKYRCDGDAKEEPQKAPGPDDAGKLAVVDTSTPPNPGSGSLAGPVRQSNGEG